jgi:hypothetical protein
MAFSSSLKKSDVSGTTPYKIYTCDFASVTTGHIKTGFSTVIAAFFNNGVTEGQGLVKINRNSADDAAEAGGVNVSGVTSDDTGQLIVFGY